MHTVPLICSEAIEKAYRIDELERAVAFCRSRCTRAITIDGFAGIGKSALAAQLSDALSMPLISLDAFLPDPESTTTESYVSRLDRERLHQAIRDAGTPIVEGVMLRDALSGLIAREETTALYYIVCSNPAGNLIWHDGFDIDDETAGSGADWFERSVLEYHRRVRPYTDADAIIVRVSSD